MSGKGIRFDDPVAQSPGICGKCGYLIVKGERFRWINRTNAWPKCERCLARAATRRKGKP